MMYVDLLINLGVILLFYFSVIRSESDETLRFQDKAFLSRMHIYNKTIWCAEDIQPGQFPAHTWTCRNMRVGGLRMAYGYNPYFIAEENHKCTETKGFDELGEVCRTMMRTIGSSDKLWVAFVTNATCDYTKEHRVILNMTRNGDYQWDKMGKGYGWIDTLQCMAVRN